MVKRKESQKGEMREDFEGQSKVKRGILAVCGGSDSVESWGEKGYICARRRPLMALCWPFSVLVGRCPPKGVRKPQRAGTETEAKGMTEAQSYGKVAKLAESRSKNRVRILVGLLRRWRKGRKQRGFQSSKSKEVTKW